MVSIGPKGLGEWSFTSALDEDPPCGGVGLGFMPFCAFENLIHCTPIEGVPE